MDVMTHATTQQLYNNKATTYVMSRLILMR